MSGLQDDPFEIVAQALDSGNKGVLQPLRNLIVSGEIDVNAWCDEVTLLGEVAETGDLELVRLMVEQGADVNLPTKSDASTALMQAASGGNLEVVQFLVKAGANVNEVRGGATALTYATSAGHEEVIEYLTSLTAPQLRQEAQIAQQSEKPQLISPLVGNLFNAIDAWDIEEVERLISNGVDVDAVNELGETAISYAAGRARFDIVRALLEAGANPNEISEHSLTLLTAAGFGDSSVVETLIKAGANINTIIDGRSPLMQAIEWAFSPDDVQIVRLLIEAGANLEVQDKYGNTALMIAIEKDKSEIVEMLISAGASSEQVESVNLLKACQSETIEQIQELLQSNANPNVKDTSGLSALGVAAATGNRAVVRLLIDAGVDIEAKDAKGCTPLMAAISKARIEVIQELLQAGADIHAVDEYNRNVTDHAYDAAIPKSMRRNILRILDEYGAPGKTHGR